MAKRDITGRAVKRAAELMVKYRVRINDAFPLGPSRQQLTPSELRQLQDRRGLGTQLSQEMGAEQALVALLGERLAPTGGPANGGTPNT